jgi:hypothetical protein
MVKDGDIFGDGVNIAVRLEGLAEPGGICISRGVHDHVRRKLPYGFEDLGEQSVKNIAQPTRVFRLIPDVTKQSTSGREAALMPSAVLDDLPSLSELPRAPMATRPPSLDRLSGCAEPRALRPPGSCSGTCARKARRSWIDFGDQWNVTPSWARGALRGSPRKRPSGWCFWRAFRGRVWSSDLHELKTWLWSYVYSIAQRRMCAQRKGHRGDATSVLLYAIGSAAGGPSNRELRRCATTAFTMWRRDPRRSATS